MFIYRNIFKRILICFLKKILLKGKTFNENEELLYYIEMAVIVLNAGGFGGPRNSTKSFLTQDPPNRLPDTIFTEGISNSQVCFLLNSYYACMINSK